MGNLHPGHGADFERGVERMTWQDQFVKACLEKVPAGEYRHRSEAELREHLETLAWERREAGAGEDQVRQEVLARMGDPAQLQKAYQAEGLRRRALEPRYMVECWLAGVMWMDLCWFVLWLLLAAVGFSNDSGAFPLYGHPGRVLFVGVVLSVFPTLVSGWYLSGALRFHPRPVRMNCACLGLIWLVTCLEQLGLSALTYGIPVWRLGELFGRISGGSDPTFPWFTPLYAGLWLMWCLLLGIGLPQMRRAFEAHRGGKGPLSGQN